MEHQFYLSNSKMHDWETMCPIEWKAKHIDKLVTYEPTEDMEWGNYFETLVIGSSIGGRVFEFTDSDMHKKMKNSIFRERVEAQAKTCRKFLKLFGGKIVSRQEYIRAVVVDSDGQKIPIEGALDVRYAIEGRERRIVIDLKFTGDAENDFGKFAWGAPEKMDLSQIKHYGLLDQLKYGGEYPETHYWVFDKGTDLKSKLINVSVSDWALADHIERLSRVYNEIMTCITLDDWPYINTYRNCSKCPVKCKMERIMPEFYELSL